MAGQDSGCFNCVSLLWNVPLTVFEGDSQSAAAGVYRRGHTSAHTGESTQAPLLMPRMTPGGAAVPEVSIKVVNGVTQVVQLASRIPNRLAETDWVEQSLPPPGSDGGGPAAPQYPSLLLAEQQATESARREAERLKAGGRPGLSRSQPGSRNTSSASLSRVASRETMGGPSLQSAISSVLSSMPPGSGAGYQGGGAAAARPGLPRSSSGSVRSGGAAPPPPRR